MPNNPANAIVDRLIEKAREGFDAIGADMEARFRDLVSVPVEVEGSKVIRSKGGEPPRHEGKSAEKGFPTTYVESFRHETTVDGDRISTKAGTADPRGEWFTEGTPTMAKRPHGNIVRDEFAQDAVDRVTKAISQTQE